MAELRILFTTDNHIGCHELDPVRGEDSVKTFEEVMNFAVSSKCDVVLQGGDLFHVNKPSKRSMFETMRVLRQCCWGEPQLPKLELQNSPDFMPSAPNANFNDPNLRVKLPVFAISGNHDDAGGSASQNALLSPLDVLAVSGLINHVGSVSDNTNITVKPILLEKDGVKCALYAFANVKDDRLYRTFQSGNVYFEPPPNIMDGTTKSATHYCILMVHQNRNQFGPKSYLPESFLPDFLDLVLWGHEHESVPEPQLNLEKQFLVVQPGSTIATSLNQSELGRRYAFTVVVAANRTVRFEKTYLKTVRPFVFKSICLETDAPPSVKPLQKDTRARVTEFLVTEVEKMLAEVSEEVKETEMLPLVRVSVDYAGGYELENTTRFSNRFVNRVANPNDVLVLSRSRRRQRDGISNEKFEILEGEAVGNHQEASAKLVPLLLKGMLNSEKLAILEPSLMVDALVRYVEKDEKNAIKDEVDVLVKKYVEAVEAGTRSLNLQPASNERKRAAPSSEEQEEGKEMEQNQLFVESDISEDEEYVEVKRPSKRAAGSKRQTARRERTVPIEPPQMPAVPQFVSFEDDFDGTMFSDAE